MTAHVEIGGSETLTLKGALLVYQGRSRGFVSWHEAKQTADGAPFLGESEALTLDFVHGLAAGLGSHTPLEVLPENCSSRRQRRSCGGRQRRIGPCSSAAPTRMRGRFPGNGSRSLPSCGA